VRFGGSAEIECPASGERDDVARTAGRGRLRAKALIRVAGHQLLRLSNSGLHRGRIEGRSDGGIDAVRRQLDRFASGHVVGRSCSAKVHHIAFEAFAYERSDDLRERHRIGFGPIQARFRNAFTVVVQFGSLSESFEAASIDWDLRHSVTLHHPAQELPQHHAFAGGKVLEKFGIV
jgi:hypothetical protein